ncbi:MAG: M14 family zinc carboxypeptidase, partial [bacterium]
MRQFQIIVLTMLLLLPVAPARAEHGQTVTAPGSASDTDGDKVHGPDGLVQVNSLPRYWVDCGDPTPAYFGFASPRTDFYLFEQILDKLLELETAYPDLIQTTDALGEQLRLGQSERGRDIPYVRLSATAPGDEMASIFINGQIHAREPSSMMQCLCLLCDWAERYGLDPEVTFLLDSREIIVAPVLNPDGWQVITDAWDTPTDLDFWRRNCPVGRAAVDLNRNFDYNFAACNNPD